jgi:tRNA(Arg) A34 adenosine deaminase TadA
VDGGVVGVRGSVLDLVLAVGQAFPGRVHEVLRERIRVARPVTETDRAVVAVAAKRVVSVPPLRGDAGGAPFRDLAPELALARDHAARSSIDAGSELPAELGAFLAALVPEGGEGPRRGRDRPVVAVLAQGSRIVRAARNSGGSSRVHHAEINLVVGGEPFPPDATVLVSLQCCRMCAAVLLDAGVRAVRYLEPDPGRLARRTALQASARESPI